MHPPRRTCYFGAPCAVWPLLFALRLTVGIFFYLLSQRRVQINSKWPWGTLSPSSLHGAETQSLDTHDRETRPCIFHPHDTPTRRTYNAWMLAS